MVPKAEIPAFSRRSALFEWRFRTSVESQLPKSAAREKEAFALYFRISAPQTLHPEGKFLSKLNQRMFESGMGVGAPRGMAEDRVERPTGVSSARYCNWTALALDPTPIPMSIGPGSII